MTGSYKTFEFTAYEESDFGVGNIGVGSVFTVPGSPGVCFTVKDNDKKLSGDSKKNEKSNDKSGQTAEIVKDGQVVETHADIYAERTFLVEGSDGKHYTMVEIEDEDNGPDYFSFVGDVPPPGTELKVVSCENVTKKNEIKYEDISAGDKEPPTSICVEAEDLHLSGYKVEHQDIASGGELIKLSKSTGFATFKDFPGETCLYDITITLVDEDDGQGFLDVFVNGKFVGCFNLTADTDGDGIHITGLTEVTLTDIEIPAGADITFKGRREHNEFVRIDKVKFDKVEEEETFSISGRYFQDTDGDNLDVGEAEPGLAGIEVTLIDGDDMVTVIGTATTNADGSYEFADLADGNYVVEFGAPGDSLNFVDPNVGPGGINSADDIDSDVVIELDEGQGRTDVIVVNGGDVGNVDAGVAVETPSTVVAEDDLRGPIQVLTLFDDEFNPVVFDLGNALTGTGASISGLGADFDPDGDSFQVSRLGTDTTPDSDGFFGFVDGTRGGELRLNVDGTIEFRDIDGDFVGLSGAFPPVEIGQTVTTQFEYEIIDSTGATDTAIITIELVNQEFTGD
ncbi:MAG: SdrD B-like domain-containing protein [Pseudomonadota bacterium]